MNARQTKNLRCVCGREAVYDSVDDGRLFGKCFSCAAAACAERALKARHVARQGKLALKAE